MLCLMINTLKTKVKVIEIYQSNNMYVCMYVTPRSILNHIFCPKKDKLFGPAFVFRRWISSAIFDLVLYLEDEGLNIS